MKLNLFVKGSDGVMSAVTEIWICWYKSSLLVIYPILDNALLFTHGLDGELFLPTKLLVTEGQILSNHKLVFVYWHAWSSANLYQ